MSLDGFLVTVNDADEDQWLFDTFAIGDSVTRHMDGLSDHEERGIIDGTMELHLYTEIGVMVSLVMVMTKIMFTSQAPTWEVSTLQHGMIWRTTHNTSLYTES